MAFVGLGGGCSPGRRGVRRVICCSEDVDNKLVTFRQCFEGFKRIPVDAHTLRLIREEVSKIRDEVKVIVEVRDPRVPMSSYSTMFKQWRKELNTESMVIYTKAEIVPEDQKERIRAFTMDQMDIPYEQVFFEDLRRVRRLRTPDRQEMVSKMKRLALLRGQPTVKRESYKVMVTGVPNSGKSSVVYVSTRTLTKNRKRRGLYSLPPVGFQVGTTKVIGQNWLTLNPDVVLLDTPGVISKSHTGAEDPETPYKLAVCQCISLTKMSEQTGITAKEVADYLLFKLNQARELTYTRIYDLILPTDDIDEVLQRVPGATDELKALRFLRDFQRNKLGFLVLDDIPEIETDRPDKEEVDDFVDQVERKFQEVKRRSRLERVRQKRLMMWKDEPEETSIARKPPSDFNF